MPILKDRQTETITSAKGPRRRPRMRRRYKTALALLTLLAVLGKAVQADTQAIQAVVQVIHHLHLFGF